MEAIDVLARIAHIGAAVTLGGGLIYQWTVLYPGLGSPSAEEPSSRAEEVRGRWSRLVMVSVVLLLLSGLYNYFGTIRLDKQGVVDLPRFFHPLIGTKILLALVVFFVASLLAGRSEGARRFQAKAPWWLGVASLLVLAIISIAGILKTADRSPAGKETADRAAATVEAPSR